MNRLLYIFLFFGSALHAQITITKNDMPSVNDNIIYSNSSTIGINFNPAKTGANQTWDYSSLTPSSQGIYNFVSSLQTPYLAYFFNTIGIKTQDTLNLVFVKFSNIHDFYKKTDLKYSIVGRGFSYQGIPLPANFDIEDKIYNFPLKFGDKDSTPFYFKLTDPTGTLPFRYAQTGWRVTNVDGWGSITTPYGSFSCIRVKTKLITTDSVTISGFTFPIKRTSYEYRWLTNGEKIPLLQINGTETFGNFIVSQVLYRDIERAITPVANFTASAIQGIPGDEMTLTDQSLNKPTEWIWTISPNTYTFMWGTNAGSQNVNVRFDSVGIYDISLRASNKAGYDDITKNAYINIAKPNTGINILSDENFSIFPNPARDHLYINLDKTSHTNEIEILQLDGKKIASYHTQLQNFNIDLSTIAAGTYAIRINGIYRLFVRD